MARRKQTAAGRFANVLALLLVLAAIGAVAIVYARWKFREQRYNQLITEVAAQYGVDRNLVKAVMRRESEFDPTVRGRSGEVGLMQVMPGTGMDWAAANRRKGFTKEQLWNERNNIEAGAWYLARGLRHWSKRDDPMPFALAEYNAGRGHCLRWLPKGEATTAEEFMDAITFPGVRRYIETVLEHYEYYRASGQW